MHFLASRSLLPQLHWDDCVCNLLEARDGRVIG